MTALRSPPPCGMCARVALALGAKPAADLAGLAAFYVGQLHRAEHRIRNRDAIDDAVTGAQGVIWGAWPLLVFESLLGIHDPVLLIALAAVIAGAMTGLTSLVVRWSER